MKKMVFNYIIFLILAVSAFNMACSPSKSVIKEDGIARKSNSNEDSYAFEDNGKNSDELSFEESTGESDEKGEDPGGAAKENDSAVKGVASWYGRAFHGRKTASGERFDMYDYTAAHRKYPFGTVLEVKNLENGKIVKVRVNDRGPYKDDRIIDLSYAAGRKLGMLAKGKVMVGIKVLSGKKQEYDDEPAYGTKVDNNAEENEENYQIQAGAFYSRRNAEKLQSRIQGMISENKIVITRENDFYKVRITGISSRVTAERYKAILADEQIPGFIINK